MMFPSLSSSTGMHRRMLLEAMGIGSSNIKCRDEDATASEGQRIVIADAMLSMSASPGPGNEHGYSQQHKNMGNFTDSDSDALQEMPLSPCQLDDDGEQDDDGDNVLDLIMDQDSSEMKLESSCRRTCELSQNLQAIHADNTESPGSAHSRMTEKSGMLGNAAHPQPRKKGRPAKFSVGGTSKSGAECPICGKVFNNSSALAKHKLTHSSERKYVCRLCGKTFKRQDHLNGHMLTHSSKKPFECRVPSCGRSYCDARSLRRHHDNYHSRQPEIVGGASLPLKAEGLVAPALSNFISNRLVVSAQPSSPARSENARELLAASNSSDSSCLSDMELPHECELCGRRFKNLPALNGHMRLHGGYFKKDIGFASASEVAKLEPGSLINVTISNAHDNQWNASGLLLSAAQASSSHGESLPSALSTAAVLPAVILSNHSDSIDCTENRQVVSSSSAGLFQLDPMRLNYFLSARGVNSLNSVLAAGVASGVTRLTYEKDQTRSLLMAGGHVRDVAKQTTDDLDYLRTFADPNSNDNASLMRISEPLVYFANTTDADLHTKNNVTESTKIIDLKTNLTINTGPESVFQFVPARGGTAVNYPAIQQLLQRGSSKVADIDGTDSLQTGEGLSIHTDSNHIASCTDKSCIGCHLSTVTDSERSSKSQWQGAEDSAPQQSESLEWSRDSMGFETYDRNPLSLLQEVAEAVDTRESPHHDVADRCDHVSSAYDHAEFPVPVSSLSGLYHKFRRKNRPEPLFIPSPVTNFGFQSRLRSPHVITDQPALPVPVSLAQMSMAAVSTSTFMPYTPPPMLSPLRTGSGLFYSLVQPSPKSAAPVGLRLGLIRSNSINSNAHNAPLTSMMIEEEEEEDEEEEEYDEDKDELLDLPVIEAEEEIHEVDLAPPPQTDVSPHINIGPDYQADVPIYSANRASALIDSCKADLMWDPVIMKTVTEDDVRRYLDFACCAAVPNCGTNKEFALHLLNLFRGDIKMAALKLMQREPRLPTVHSLHNYKYAETTQWSSDEIELYQQAMIQFDKDFFRVSKQVKTKSVRECTEFYFLWKKVCVDEWRRMRVIRRKRINDSLYNLRSTAEQPKINADGGHGKSIDGEGVANQSASSLPASAPSVHPDTSVPTSSELFPCRICGKVFDRVKSRSAHMKSHRQMEVDSQHRPFAAYNNYAK